MAVFRDAGATSASAATTPASLGVSERVAFAALRDHAVLREAGPGSGKYYLDEPSWEALRRFRRRFALVFAVVALVALLANLIRR